MDLGQYGPFAYIVGVACALVAVFELLLFKMVGKISRWTWLAENSPPFLVTAGPRAVAVALMAVTYVIIDRTNYVWFGGGAVLLGVIGFLMVAKFDHLRRLYVLQVPQVGVDGRQLIDRNGNALYFSVIIGLESNMRYEARRDLEETRKRQGPVSIPEFMSGYGTRKLNDPEALWQREVLAANSNKLIITLMYVVLSAVLALFLAAIMIDVYGR